MVKMPEIDQKYIQNKFIEYCKVNTRSDEQSTAVPTTAGQVDLLKIIEKELEKLGLENIFLAIFYSSVAPLSVSIF